ncbi:MAG: YhjD/YihY/BrkB family envelope integrity protein, partial [Planctomycetota bacterium]
MVYCPYVAKLRDLPHVVSHVGPWKFLKRVYLQSTEDNMLVWAAALAYSWLFALFPFLIFCLSLIPLLPNSIAGREIRPDKEEIRGYLNSILITGSNPGDVADNLEEMLAVESDDPRFSATQPASSTAPATTEPMTQLPETGETAAPAQPTSPVADAVAALLDKFLNERPTSAVAFVSIGLAIFFASGGMAMTMAGLDKCYDVQYDKMRPVWKSRPIAMLLTFTVGLLILLTVILIPVGGALLRWASNASLGAIDFSWIMIAAVPLRWLLGLLLLLSALALVYRWGPSLKTKLNLLSPGAIFAVTMWIVTAFGFRFYIDGMGAADNYARTYGEIG